jgi:aryl-alcohol dehydrogenase-like predicted oxidoreductase
MALLDLVRAWAVQKGLTPSQLSLAWLLAELREFREVFSRIKVAGARKPESFLQDL